MIHPIKYLQGAIKENRDDKTKIKSTPLFAPAGQSTQMVIGATPETDLHILYTADHFYKKMSLKRVYYSGYVPISTDNRLPAIGTPVPMIRENRLYQADWLMRFYGFGVNEIITPEAPVLDLEIDPKLAWALRNLHLFPIDINKAELPVIKRIPGIGVSSALKIIAARKFGRLTWDHLQRFGLAMNRARYFIHCSGDAFQQKDHDAARIRQFILKKGKSKYQPTFAPQLTLF